MHPYLSVSTQKLPVPNWLRGAAWAVIVVASLTVSVSASCCGLHEYGELADGPSGRTMKLVSKSENEYSGRFAGVHGGKIFLQDSRGALTTYQLNRLDPASLLSKYKVGDSVTVESVRGNLHSGAFKGVLGDCL